MKTVVKAAPCLVTLRELLPVQQTAIDVEAASGILIWNGHRLVLERRLPLNLLRNDMQCLTWRNNSDQYEGFLFYLFTFCCR